MLSLVRSIMAKIHMHRDPVGYARKQGVRIGKNCRLFNVSFGSEPYLVELGDHVSATSVSFVTHDGGVWVFREELDQIDVVAPIKVGNNVFFGLGVVVLPNVRIGDNVVVGAGSIVSKDVPSNVVAAGVPARVICELEAYKTKVIEKSENTKHLGEAEKKRFYLNKFFRNS